ncbi:MAG: hypothetical protein KBD90_03250 [Alphaproteobacteria bacterium]|nr:hypothetical protein [Alphaproteobacteria bacterium]
MFNIIEQKDHFLYQEKIDSLLGLLKIYQDFSLSPKNQEKSTFIIAENDTRGIYGGAVFYPQKTKDELQETLSNFLSFSQNRTVWCTCLCFCPDDREKVRVEAIELCENFYVELYEILGDLGEKKSTNCLPIALSLQDYHHSLVHGNWSYLKAEPDGEDDVYGLLSLPDKRRQSQEPRASVQAKNKGKNLISPLSVPGNDPHHHQHQSQTERSAQ